MNANLPSVTIAIPFYNAESTLLDAVRSVFAQTHQDWELILIDDGSTDNSLDLARSIKDPRVRVYSDGLNRRLAARLNEVVSLASFDFIARMDADDLMAKDRIEKELEVLVNYEECDLVSTGVLSLTDDYQPVGLRTVNSSHVVSPRSLLLCSHGIVHASILARKSWFERNRYREALPFAEDYSLWISSYSKGDLRIRFLSEPMYFYREDSSASPQKLLKAYSVNRSIILQDAKSNFSFLDKAFVYIRSLSQSLVIYLLDKFGGVGWVRGLRVKQELTVGDRSFYLHEIDEIKSFDLPLS
ncbi:glycosyltransferase family 2 protein [Halomonas smyrnensis]|uniref:glycosyltransferase family 2 protein n=1 Tax=Halomonas smyrnensis TaxID=720605 RepID=UPI0003191A4F|nr:glycosyltransferase family 2 protein [Halomonas smyrnensis]